MASVSISSNSVPLYSIFLRGTASKLGSQFGDALAAVSLDNADDDVFAAAVAANGFAEHRESLANARRVAEKKLQIAPGCFFGETASSHCSGVFGIRHSSPMGSGVARLE